MTVPTYMVLYTDIEYVEICCLDDGKQETQSLEEAKRLADKMNKTKYAKLDNLHYYVVKVEKI